MHVVVFLVAFVVVLTAHQLLWRRTHRSAVDAASAADAAGPKAPTAKKRVHRWWSRSDPDNPSPIDRSMRLAVERPALGIPVVTVLLAALGFVIGADGYGRGTLDQGIVFSTVAGIFGLVVATTAASRGLR